MAHRFEAEVQQLDQFTYVKVSGTIDEDNDLAALAQRIRGDTAVIDLSAVHDINSCGVRDWVRWRENLQGRGITVVLVECSSAIVAKLNTVSNFNAGGFLKSFYVPYYCQACETEKGLLVEMDEFRGDGPPRPPTCRCDACDGIMAFDDLEESYFAFVKEARKGVPPEVVQQLLDHLAPAAGERKIISGAAWGQSSFVGIPSTSSVSGAGFGGETGSRSGVSAASLRRLRDKTGLRTMRRVGDGNVSDGTRVTLGRWLLIGGILAAVLIGGAVVLARVL